MKKPPQLKLWLLTRHNGTRAGIYFLYMMSQTCWNKWRKEYLLSVLFCIQVFPCSLLYWVFILHVVSHRTSCRNLFTIRVLCHNLPEGSPVVFSFFYLNGDFVHMMWILCFCWMCVNSVTFCHSMFSPLIVWGSGLLNSVFYCFFGGFFLLFFLSLLCSCRLFLLSVSALSSCHICPPEL